MRKILIIAIAQFLFSCSIENPEKEIYLIPSDYEGQFRVIYGEKCGITPTYENGRRVMVIPENGLLIIQPPFVAGWIDNEYYFVDTKGKRTKLNQLYNYKERLKKSPGVLLGGSGSYGGAMPDGSSSSESPFAIHFTDFTVYNHPTTIDDKQYSRLQTSFDSLTTVSVETCRKNNK